MKKALTIFLLIILSIIVKGQIIITPNDFPYAGLNLEIFVAEFSPNDSILITDTSIFKIGSGGQNMEYDFSKIESYITDTFTIEYVLANNTPFFSFYPNSDLATIEDSGKLYKYYSIDSTSFLYIGYTEINVSDTTHFIFSGSELQMTTNYIYNFQYNGYYGYGIQYDSISGMSVLTKDTIKIDSYGSLKTSQDTFQVLRAYINSESHHVYYQFPYQVDFFENNKQYKYFANNIGYPLATVMFDFEYNKILNIQLINTIKLFQSFSEATNPNDFNVYPNPNNGKFIIKFSNITEGDYLIEVRNVIGQLVYTAQVDNVPGKFTKQIDLSELNRGVYFLTISNSTEIRTEKLIVY